MLKGVRNEILASAICLHKILLLRSGRHTPPVILSASEESIVGIKILHFASLVQNDIKGANAPFRMIKWGASYASHLSIQLIESKGEIVHKMLHEIIHFRKVHTLYLLQYGLLRFFKLAVTSL